MTKKDIVDLELRSVGLFNDEKAREHANARLRLAYENFYNAFDWRDAKCTLVALPSYFSTENSYGLSNTITLPDYIESVQGMSYDNSFAVRPSNYGNLIELSPNVFDEQKSKGSPILYSPLSPSSATKPITSAGVLTFASSSASDVGVEVSVVGSVNATQVVYREVVLLDGTNNVSTVNQYDFVSEISKPETIGNISVSANSSVISTILANDNKNDFVRIMISCSIDLDDNKQILMLCRKRFSGFWSDSDTIKIPAAEQAIIATLKAELLEYKQDWEKAKEKRNDANSFFIQAVKNERELAAFDVKMSVDIPCRVSVRGGSSNGTNMFAR